MRIRVEFTSNKMLTVDGQLTRNSHAENRRDRAQRSRANTVSAPEACTLFRRRLGLYYSKSGENCATASPFESAEY
jgi:hypothetical protein